MSRDVDVVVVGGGIVGLATARALLVAEPGRTVAVLEREPAVALHQTGRNSGVVHSGIYYAPGSTKALTTVQGRAELLRFCADHGVPTLRRGKVIVATAESELAGLGELAHRARVNGVPAVALDGDGLRRIEPRVAGIAALHVPGVEVVDYGAVARALAADVAERGGVVRTGVTVETVRPEGVEVVVTTDAGTWRAGAAVACAGLRSDELARRSGAAVDLRIVPFRGEYHELVPARRDIVRGLVYPVPDPRFPFLGVHLTPMVDGSVHVGPNAVLALAREGYGWGEVDWRFAAGLLGFGGTWHLARRYGRTGAAEVLRSVSRRALLRALRRLVPDVGLDDLVPAPAGVRAQAVTPDGRLLDDFELRRDGPVVHVLNAPSPAATASFAIGRLIAEQLPAAR